MRTKTAPPAPAPQATLPSLPKAPTGINGLDDVTRGGLPAGRPTLICGGAGCGKTLMATEFLVHGAMEFGEPGVFMSFEERPEELAQNVRSLGFDIDQLIADQKLVVDHVQLDRSQIDETGDYDLEGLFVRLGFAIDSVKAKRVVLDTIETLFSGLTNHGVLRSELRRLFGWLKDRGVTAVITCERGDGTLTRHGLEEYVSDCVILLDHRVNDQVSTRRLRIVKYRGSSHGMDEYPFLITESGISVVPISALGLDHTASTDRISTGVERLDAMLGGGVYRGSTVLVSGTAGTGKTSLAAHFARAVAASGERCLYAAFEESPGQIKRNMRSIGVDLAPYEQQGLVQFHAARPTVYGLEMHLVMLHKLVREFRPSAVVLDPISNLMSAGNLTTAIAMLTRLIDFLKSSRITAWMSTLTSGSRVETESEIGISSLVDTWMLLRDLEANGERNRGLYVLKSRGMAHSNQIREFLLTSDGIALRDVYIGAEGVLTGSARLAQEARERAARMVREQAVERKRRDLARRRKALEASIAALQAEYEIEESEAQLGIAEERAAEQVLDRDRKAMGEARQADNGNQLLDGSRRRL